MKAIILCPQLSWQTLRVEAKSMCDQALTPLRLITNQARCRITIKKKLTGDYILLLIKLVKKLESQDSQETDMNLGFQQPVYHMFQKEIQSI